MRARGNKTMCACPSKSNGTLGYILETHCTFGQISVGSAVKQCWASPVLGWVTIQGVLGGDGGGG